MSYTQAVQQLSEALSEAVSKFTLYVVKMKEANQVAPPALVNAVDTIGQQTVQLVNIANGLSNGYNDYPSIKASIQSEAAGLDSAQKNLVSTCNSMSGAAGSSQLSDSWQRLSQSCKDIATAIIKLLEILYGAETQRIYIVNQKLQQAVTTCKNLPPNTQDVDQQKFADSASDVATYANHLAQFLQIRAQGEESPLHQQELQSAAQELLAVAQDIVSQANECMDEPEDKSRAQVYHQKVQKAADTAAVIVDRIKQLDDQRRSLSVFTPPQPKSPAPQPAKPAPVAAAPVSKPAPVAAAAPVNKPAPVAAAPVSKPAPQPASSGQKPPQKRPAQAQPSAKPQNMNQVVDSAKDFAKANEGKAITGGAAQLALEIEKLAKAAKEGNGAELLNCARNISTITATFADAVRDTSKKTNPRMQDNLVQDSKCLRDLCTQLKILASVKASLIQGDSNMDKDQQLIELTNNLVKMWQQTGDHLQIADLLH